ncbi:MAG TPA: DUF6049 family protein, partial [Acidimicrobiales bacterium]|nr:DUF6049 family protein [Acidimicrobiales bacterium]
MRAPLALVLVAGAVAAGAVPGAPAAEAGSPARQPAPAIRLVEQTTWLRDGDEFRVSVDVTGAPAGASLQLVVHEHLETRGDFHESLDGELGAVVATPEPRPLAELSTNGPANIGFMVGDGGQFLPSIGVYPVEVLLVDAEGAELASLLTHLTYLPGLDDPRVSGSSPIAVSVVVDIGGPPAHQPDGTTVPMSPPTMARIEERVDLLARAPEVLLTLAPVPETLDALAAQDGQQSSALTALVDATGDRPVLARPYSDIDLAALGSSGLEAEADEQARAGADVVRDVFGRDPTSGIWLSGPTLGAEAARSAVELGTDRALVPPSAVGELPTSLAGPVPDAPVTLDGGGPLTMVSDAELGAHLTGEGGVLGAQRFLAELATMWFQRPTTPRAVVVHLPPDDEIDPEVVAEALRALTHGQAVRAVPLDEVFDDIAPDPDGPTTADLTGHEITDDLGTIAAPLGQARRDIGGVQGMVDSRDEADSLQRSLLLATASATPNNQRPAYVERVTSTLGSLEDAVDLPDEFRITLTSRTSTIPVNITNNSDGPLTVRVELASGQLEFLDGDVITQELQPGVTRLEVPVRIRTSGAFPLGITVTSPDGTVMLDQTTFDIRSTAITGVGFALAIGAGLFLVVWWGRHWRRARRSR